MATKYRCSFCGKVKRRAWRCGSCGYILCSNCSKGGKSTALGAMGRTVAAAATYGASEVVRWGYRKANQKCHRCGGSSLVSV